MVSMRKSRISVYKQDRLIEHFVSGSTARTAAALVGVNKTSAAYFYHRLREIIVFEIEQESHDYFEGEIEVDESYFGGRRKGKRGRGAAGKVPVFGLLKRGGKVYTKVIPIVGAATTSWMYLILSTSASTIPNCLQTRRTTLTELRIFGIKPSVICANSMVFQRSILGYF